jgi:hypothetical protein
MHIISFKQKIHNFIDGFFPKVVSEGADILIALLPLRKGNEIQTNHLENS